MLNKTALHYFFSGLLSLLWFSLVSADGLVPCGGPGQPACTICHFFLLTQQALRYALVIVPIAAALVLVACGFNLMINRGNPGATSKTRFVMLTVIAGLLMVFAGWVAVNSYFASAGAADWNGYSLTHDWWKINSKCAAPAKDSEYCGDGLVTGEEQCDPEESIAACQGRTGNTKDMCQTITTKCSADCTVEYCGDGIVQAGEQCDPNLSLKDCIKTTGKNVPDCQKFIDSCTADCKTSEIVDNPPADKGDDDNPPPYEEGRCLKTGGQGPHVPDCPEVHTGLAGYKLIKKDFYVALGSYHSSALSPITAKGPNGEKICMCFDACAYSEKFKYVLTNEAKSLFDIYATPAGEAIYKQMGDAAILDDTKPVVYLYPEKETQISVTVMPKGKMTASIPAYNNGWNVTVEPGGLIDKKYGYLFYETETSAKDVKIPFAGFTVAYADLGSFFDTILPKVGLRGQEIVDFKNWWLGGRLKPANYYLVRLLDGKTIDEVEPINVDPKPDTLIRVRFLFTPLENKVETIEPAIVTPQRSGFTAVEWGGLIEK